MKVKVRVSHFTTKDISVTATNSTTARPDPISTEIISTKKEQIEPQFKESSKIISINKPLKGIKLERFLIKETAKYAFIPVPATPEIIERTCFKKLTEFRQRKLKQSKIRIAPYIKNGEVKEKTSTNSFYDNSSN